MGVNYKRNSPKGHHPAQSSDFSQGIPKLPSTRGKFILED